LLLQCICRSGCRTAKIHQNTLHKPGARGKWAGEFKGKTLAKYSMYLMQLIKFPLTVTKHALRYISEQSKANLLVNKAIIVIFKYCNC